MYILIAAVGFSLLAVVSIFDKFILTKKATSPALYAFYNNIFFLALCVLFPFISLPMNLSTWAFAALAGLSFSLAMWVMYIGVEKGEVSHVGPLVGAAVPLFTLFLGRFFLNEVLSFKQLAAVALLIIGSLLIAFEKKYHGRALRSGTIWGFISGLIFAVSLVSIKFVYSSADLFTGLALVWFFSGVGGIFFLSAKSVRQSFKQKKAGREKKRFLYIITNMVLGTAGTLLVQGAISLGSVTIVNSLEGVRYGLLVVLVAVLSKFFPKIFREDHTRWEIVQEALAVLLIASGLIILV